LRHDLELHVQALAAHSFDHAGVERGLLELADGRHLTAATPPTAAGRLPSEGTSFEA
jgi:hypothetical protein